MEVTKIATNEGKRFEQDFTKSVPNTCWLYRLRDNASSFSGGTNTRFASSNICDYILFDDITKKLFLIECKSTKNTSMATSLIRDTQLSGLAEASKHKLIAGFLINFRNESNDTFFITINSFNSMMESINKKSFNTVDLSQNGAIKIRNEKKRTRYRYNIQDLLDNFKYKE